MTGGGSDTAPGRALIKRTDAEAAENQTETGSVWRCRKLSKNTQTVGVLCGGFLFASWTLQIICHNSTSDVPATALLYDIVNAVYTKMYFYGSCENVYS